MPRVVAADRIDRPRTRSRVVAESRSRAPKSSMSAVSDERKGKGRKEGKKKGKRREILVARQRLNARAPFEDESRSRPRVSPPRLSS